MNEEKIAVMKGSIVSKVVVLANPDKYKDTPMMCISIQEDCVPALRAFLQDKKVDLGNLEVTLQPWPEIPSERAKKFFFMVRDRVAKAQGDDSRSNKDALYRECIKSFKFMDRGYPKESMKVLDKREVWLVTEKMHSWASEAGCIMTDLDAEWTGLSDELRNEIREDDHVT